MRILAIAYACDPTEGSEPGAGWMWSRLLARLGDVTVVTRANNREAIEAELLRTPESHRLEFLYVDLPAWSRFWKKGQRGMRLYYLIWQGLALREARRAHSKARFDVVWHLTLASYWLGSIGGLIGPPFVLGPVGGGVRPCLRRWLVGWRGILYEVGRGLARTFHHRLNPLVRFAIRKAVLILVNNPDTASRLKVSEKVEIFPNVLVASSPIRSHSSPPKVAMYAGRLLPSKGVMLAIRSLVRLPGWRLRIFGTGSDEDRLRRAALGYGVADRVSFEGWVARDDLQRIMAEEVSVFVFPSVHDNAPWVVGEAAAHGLPIVCLDQGGTPAVAGVRGVPLRGADRTVADFADAIRGAQPGVGRVSWDPVQRERQLREVLASRGLLASSDRG